MYSSVSVVILAAGLGTRMRSKKAKVLHEAGGLPVVEHVVRTALSCVAPENIVVVTGHQASVVEDRLRPHGIRFARQTEQLGTGHAMLCCRVALSAKPEYIVVLYGDSPLLTVATLRELIARQLGSDTAATVITTELADPTGYGRILIAEDGSVAGIVEQKAASPAQLEIRQINSGIYCFKAELMWNALDRVTPNPASGEIYLTDVVELLDRDGLKVRPMELADASQLLGINTRIELAEADRILRKRRVEELMLSGVTIEQPATVVVDPGVTVGMDSVIEPFVQLLGDTHIGENCRVGACSILRNATIQDEVTIRAFCHVEDSTLETGAQVGPYSRLRMGATAAAGSHIGNFVELKKTRLGEGSKAMHLAYLGDSEIGAKVNIGAGTITCNYDGAKKHQTTIEAGAFVGSNSTLVAPVTIGEGSYIGAGSVITKPVPAGGLGIGRAQQLVKEGWVAARKAKKIDS